MSILDTILEYKRTRRSAAAQIAYSTGCHSARGRSYADATRDFAGALRKADGTVALIAEVKRASPSKGIFIKGEFKPVEIAQAYEAQRRQRHQCADR